MDVDEEASKRDDDDHHRGERVNQVAPVGDEVHHARGGGHRAGRYPLKENLLVNALAGWQVKEFQDGAEGVEKREKYAADAEEINGLFRQAATKEEHDGGAHQRKKRDQPEMREEIAERGHGRAFTTKGARLGRRPLHVGWK